MRKIYLVGLMSVLFIGLSSFELHKFYVAIYAINYAPEKKRLQITSRIFIDDLNKALENKYGRKTNLGEQNESTDDVALMNKYVLEKFSIKVNGHSKPMHFISKEFENNVLIGYYSIKDVPKINTLEVQNTILMDLTTEQQNIIQSNLQGKKQSLLLTNDNISGMLKE